MSSNNSKSYTPPTPYAVVHFGPPQSSGHARFIHESSRDGMRLLIQIEEPDGGAEVRLISEEQRLKWIEALQQGGVIE